MAVLDHHSSHNPASEKRCALRFLAFWAGFFVLIGAITWLGSAI